MASKEIFSGLELCYHGFKDQVKRNADAIVLFVHWYLVKNNFQCIVDGKKTEILPQSWNANDDIYVINYSYDSKGYELKVLFVDESLIINLMKKSTERTASATCVISNHVSNFKNEYQNIFMNLQDLYDLIDKEFQPLFKESKASTENASSSEPARRVNPPETNPHDPLRIGQPVVPPRRPDDYGRSDLDPFYFNPAGTGGMIFDPFRSNQRIQPGIPGNLPRGAVPPGARFDPYGPPNPDDLPGNPSRVGPNPSHLRRPNFGDDMFM